MKRISLGGLLFLICAFPVFSRQQERLSLNEAIDMALQHNPEIIGARHSIDEAQGRFWRGISPPPPSLTWSYDYIPTGAGINSYGERKVEVSQTLDFPTTIALRGSSLSSARDAADADYRTTSLEVILRVKEAYYGVLASQQKVRIAEENLAIATDFARKADIRESVGEGTNLERLTARVQRTQAENSLETAHNELGIAMGVLNHALGTGKDQAARELVLTDSLMYRPCLLILDSLMRKADMLNPQVQSGTFRAKVASVNRSIAWSSILPNLFVSYSRQTQGGISNLYGLAFGISLPIWFLLDQRGQIEEAAASYVRAEADLQATQNSVILEVKNAYLEMKNDERQVRLFHHDILPQAEEVFRAAATSYEAGEITYIEFLQARQTLISARSSSIDALLHYNVAIARLEKAVGGPIDI